MKNIIFDLGGVVLRWDPENILRNFYADETSRSIARAAIFQHPDWLEMDLGTLSDHDALQRFHTRTGQSLSELSALLDAIKQSLQPIPETIDLLHELSQRGVPLYCLSNMSVATFAHVRKQHNFWGLFRGIVISGEIKLMKPDPLIFEYISTRFKLKYSDTLFVDDHSPNIESANFLGLHTLLFKNPQQCRVELFHWLHD